jgi:Leucine-rich repeat (LRR) protein
LNCNEIADIDGDTFDGLTSLNLLHLNNNKLKDVKKSWFNEKGRLYRLSLNKNEIADIDGDAFDGLNSLASLVLFKNKLKKVKKSWFNNKVRLSVIEL